MIKKKESYLPLEVSGLTKDMTLPSVARSPSRTETSACLAFLTGWEYQSPDNHTVKPLSIVVTHGIRFLSNIDNIDRWLL